MGLVQLSLKVLNTTLSWLSLRCCYCIHDRLLDLCSSLTLSLSFLCSLGVVPYGSLLCWESLPPVTLQSDWYWAHIKITHRQTDTCTHNKQGTYSQNQAVHRARLSRRLCWGGRWTGRESCPLLVCWYMYMCLWCGVLYVASLEARFKKRWIPDVMMEPIRFMEIVKKGVVSQVTSLGATDRYNPEANAPFTFRCWWNEIWERVKCWFDWWQ